MRLRSSEFARRETGKEGGSGEPREEGNASTTPDRNTSADGGVTVGQAIARVELEPVGDTSTGGTAVFKEVGGLGVQIELDI